MGSKLTNLYFLVNEVYSEGLITHAEKRAIDQQSRCICNYIYRTLRAKDQINFSPARIAIDWTTQPSLNATRNTVATVVEVLPRVEELRSIPFERVETLFSKLRRQKWPERQLEPEFEIVYSQPGIHELFASVILDASDVIQREVGLSAQPIILRINEFRAGGYTNRWVLERKYFKEFGLHTMIVGDLTNTRMYKNFVVMRGNEELLNVLLCTSETDENFWIDVARKIDFKDGSFSIGYGTYVFSLDEILK
jgi:hypothetical protein